MTEKKSADAFVLVSENGILRRNVATTDFQVGYPGKPAELHVTGKFSQSTATLNASPGQTANLDDAVSILHVKTSSGSGSVTVVLPSSPREGQMCYIKDSTGTASSNNIVVSGGKYLIDGSSSRTLSTSYDSLILSWSGSSWSTLGGTSLGAQGPTGATGASFGAVTFAGVVTTSSWTGGTTTKYLYPGGYSGATSSASAQKMIIPFAGTLSNFYVMHNATSERAGSITITYTIKNETSGNSAVITVNSSASSGNNTTSTISVSTGDQISVSAAYSARASPNPEAVVTMKFN